jgi:hypothetical protein
VVLWAVVGYSCLGTGTYLYRSVRTVVGIIGLVLYGVATDLVVSGEAAMLVLTTVENLPEVPVLF